jgi:hypothetical protein
MARSIDNMILHGLSGSIGETLTFRQRGRRTFVSKYRKPTTIPATEKLQSVRLRFADCIAYAKSAVKNPEMRARYQAAIKGGQTAFNVATSDALNPPEIKHIDATGYLGNIGESILVTATDDFMVAAVSVSILNTSGDLIEQGNANIQPDKNWIYIASNLNPEYPNSVIAVTAEDQPGNTTTSTITLS